MSVTHNITLDIAKSTVRLDQGVHVRTGDKSSQTVKCALTKDGAAYTPASGATAKLEVLKPDGTWTVTSATVSGSNVSGVVPLEAMSAPGECKRAYFRLISGSAEDTTEDFRLFVYPNATQEAIESLPFSDEFEALLEASESELAGIPAELADIRLGYDGTTYSTAGDAVRGQVGDIQDALPRIKFYDDVAAGTWEQGTINAQGVESASPKRIRCDLFSVPQGDRVWVDFDSSVYKCSLLTYDENGTFVKARYWLTKSFGILFDGKAQYRIVVSKISGDSEANIVPADASEFHVMHKQATENLAAWSLINGYILPSTGDESNSEVSYKAYVRTNGYMHFKSSKATIRINEDLMLFLMEYEQDGTYIRTVPGRPTYPDTTEEWSRFVAGVHVVDVDPDKLYKATAKWCNFVGQTDPTLIALPASEANGMFKIIDGADAAYLSIRGVANSHGIAAGQWTQGSLGRTDGGEVIDATRARTYFFENPDGDRLVVDAADGYQFAVLKLDSADYSVIYDKYWFEGQHGVIGEDGTVMRIAVRKSDNSAITVSEADAAVKVRRVSRPNDLVEGSLCRGTMSTATGTDRDDDAYKYNRARTNGFLRLRGTKANLIVDEGWWTYLWTYAADGTFEGVNTTPYKAGSHAISVNPEKLYRLNFRKDDGSSFEPFDVVGFVRLYDNYVEAEFGADGVMDDRLYQQLGYTSNGRNSAQTNFRMLHFSDIHGNGDSLAHIKERTASLSGLDAIVCTGDLVNAQWSDDFGFWDENGTADMMFAMGNHDEIVDRSNWNDVSNYKTMAECYTRYYASIIAAWGVQYEAGKTYFYKDYDSVRLVFLDLVQDYLVNDAVQLSWFEGVLSGARTAGKAVIVCEHFPPNKRTAIEDAGAWYDTVYSYNQVARWVVRNAWHDAVESFIDEGGEFVCWLCGHTHADLLSYNSDYPRQIFVVIDTASPLKASPYSDTKRTAGTDTHDLFNVLGVDTMHKTVRVMRVGASENMFMQSKKGLCFSYATHQVIGRM